MITFKEKTQSYYDSIRASDLCQCADCVNYYSQVAEAYPDLSAYLVSIGIDIRKPLELSALEPDEQGLITYSACQYVVFGDCEESFHEQIGEVKIRRAQDYPSTNIEEAHFVLELYPILLRR